jgi:hypothetical protein
MTSEQAMEVLRATAKHAASMAEYIYGPIHKDAAVALINEALIVNRAAIEVQRQGKEI